VGSIRSNQAILSQGTAASVNWHKLLPRVCQFSMQASGDTGPERVTYVWLVSCVANLHQPATTPQDVTSKNISVHKTMDCWMQDISHTSLFLVVS
jgi:hypothetical protein